MHERNRTKAWIVASAGILGLVALVAAPAVMAESLTGNIISYRAGSGTTDGTLVIKTGSGNVTLKVPTKFDLASLRRGRTVKIHFKDVQVTRKNAQGKKYVAAFKQVTKKAAVLNSGEGDGIQPGEDTGGGGGGGENTGGSGGSGTRPGG